MDKELLQKLKDWRKVMAQTESIELFRVLSNKAIEDIAEIKPATKEELLTIKGIKEKKFAKYGRDILALVNKEVEEVKENGKPYTVSTYLSLLNSKLVEFKARVQGEISSLNIRSNYLFLSLKDKDDGSILNCFMWESDYQLCGISFKEGLEIVVEGFPEVYKPTGRLSFRVSLAELVGEGAFKKAYEELKKKLEKEGLFAPEIKKPIPEFPQKIGLITSETGDAIHDFSNNLGNYGFQIKFFNSRVEGQAAVRDLLSAVNYFTDKDIEVLVIIRGGGSLESLQAFNNEILVRSIAKFTRPVICGIGHERDVPLASLTADLMVSTPSIAAITLNKSWERAESKIQMLEKDIINKYQQALADRKYLLEKLVGELRQRYDFIFKKFETIKYQLNNKLMEMGYTLREAKEKLARFLDLLLTNWQNRFEWLNDYLNRAEAQLKIVDPQRQLKLGYSITSIKGKILKSIKQVRRGEELDVQVSDGKIKSQVKKYYK